MSAGGLRAAETTDRLTAELTSATPTALPCLLLLLVGLAGCEIGLCAFVRPRSVRVSRVSRVCPGSPRCLFTSTGYCTGTIVTHSVGGCTCTRADARAGVIRDIHGRRAQ